MLPRQHRGIKVNSVTDYPATSSQQSSRTSSNSSPSKVCLGFSSIHLPTAWADWSFWVHESVSWATPRERNLWMGREDCLIFHVCTLHSLISLWTHFLCELFSICISKWVVSILTSSRWQTFYMNFLISSFFLTSLYSPFKNCLR